MADPRIEHPRDCIIEVTACAICGSDLHFYDGVIPDMHSGDVVGYETMGEVVEVGSENTKLKVGGRVVVPFTISCGERFFCRKGFYSACERSNPPESFRKRRSCGATRRRVWARRGRTIRQWSPKPASRR